MATVIDALLITLGLDASKFDQAQKKSVEELRKFGQENDKQQKEAQRRAKDLAEGFEKVRNAIIGIGAAVVGINGFKDFVTQMVTGNAALGRTSKLLGMGVKDLDAWGHAAEGVGGSAASFQASMQNIVGGLQKFKMGMGGEEVVTALARLGVQAKDGAVDMYELGTALKRVRDQQGIQAALSLSQQLGMDQGTFQLMMKTDEELRELIKHLKESSGATKANSEAAQKLQQSWAELKQSGDGLAQNVFGSVAPALVALLTILKVATDAFKKFDDWAGGAASTFVATAAGISTLRVSITKLAGLFGVGSGGWLAAFFTFLRRANVGAQLLFHSEELNKGEQSELDKRWGGASNGKAGANSALQKAVSFFQSRGWSHEQAVGIAANIARESNFNPAAVGDSGNAYGIGQWHADRQANFQKLFPGKTIKGSSMDEQLAFYDWELKNTEKSAGDKLRGAKTNEEAAGIVSRYMERPAHAASEAYARGVLASSIASQSGRGGGSTVETNIAKIEVHTAATDAHGVARDMHQALQNNALITAGMTGMN
jgi:hypothetical protein